MVEAHKLEEDKLDDLTVKRLSVEVGNPTDIELTLKLPHAKTLAQSSLLFKIPKSVLDLRSSSGLCDIGG